MTIELAYVFLLAKLQCDSGRSASETKHIAS